MTETTAPVATIEDATVARKIAALSDVFGAEFGESFRDPVLCVETTLWAPMPQGMYRRDFRLLSRSLYLESVYRRRIGYNQEVLDNFARMIGEKLQAITKLFDSRTAQLQAMYSSNGFKPESVYLQAQNLYVPVIAPGARSFVQLLERLDNYYQLTGCASLLGLFDGGQRRSAELELRKAVRSFSGMVRTEQAKLRKESWRLQDERRGHPVDQEVETLVAKAEQMADEEVKRFDESTDDAAAHVPAEEGMAVLDAIVSTGIAASTVSTRGRSKAAAAQSAAAAATPDVATAASSS